MAADRPCHSEIRIEEVNHGLCPLAALGGREHEYRSPLLIPPELACGIKISLAIEDHRADGVPAVAFTHFVEDLLTPTAVSLPAN